MQYTDAQNTQCDSTFEKTTSAWPTRIACSINQITPNEMAFKILHKILQFWGTQVHYTVNILPRRMHPFNLYHQWTGDFTSPGMTVLVARLWRGGNGNINSAEKMQWMARWAERMSFHNNGHVDNTVKVKFLCMPWRYMGERRYSYTHS